MKTRFILFAMVTLLFACKESNQKIEVIEDYDNIYLPESKVTAPAVPVDDSFNDEMKETFKNIVKKLEKENGSTADVYSFGYRLYMNENGKIDEDKKQETETTKENESQENSETPEENGGAK